MGSNRFNINITVQIGLILTTCLIISWSLSQNHLLVARFTFIGLLIAQTLLLIHTVKRSNKRLISFLRIIKNRQFMERFEKLEVESSKQKINQIFNEIIEILADVKVDQEADKYFFQTILELINTSILAYDLSNNICLMNKAAKEILNITDLKKHDDLSILQKDFKDFIEELKDGDSKQYKLNSRNEILMLSISCKQIVIRNSEYKILSFQDIRSELANNELESWQKLISVLRHEIMNSISPINSLTNTLLRVVSCDDNPKPIEKLTNKDIQKTYEALLAIAKRSSGLVSFVDSYRSISRLMNPAYRYLNSIQFIESITKLYENRIKDLEIDLRLDIDDLTFNADEKLLTQAVINLLENAIDSMVNSCDKKICIKAFKEKDLFVIRIEDNGTGIDKGKLENIFVPFFTTKDNGSGIGLSLVRQIVRLHKGTVNVQSTEGKGSIFTIKI